MVVKNSGPFLGTLRIRCHNIIETPKRDHNFDNHPKKIDVLQALRLGVWLSGSDKTQGFGVLDFGVRFRVRGLRFRVGSSNKSRSIYRTSGSNSHLNPKPLNP